jgi:hypothetical protein
MAKNKIPGLFDSEGKSDFEVYPEGKYLMEVKNCVIDDTSDETMIKVRVNYEILENVDDPDETENVEGKRFTQFINIFTPEHASYEKWGHIGRSEFKDLLEAAEVPVTKSDNFESEQLIGSKVINKLKIRPATEKYPAKNDVAKSYPA